MPSIMAIIIATRCPAHCSQGDDRAPSIGSSGTMPCTAAVTPAGSCAFPGTSRSFPSAPTPTQAAPPGRLHRRGEAHREGRLGVVSEFEEAALAAEHVLTALVVAREPLGAGLGPVHGHAADRILVGGDGTVLGHVNLLARWFCLLYTSPSPRD